MFYVIYTWNIWTKINIHLGGNVAKSGTKFEKKTINAESEYDKQIAIQSSSIIWGVELLNIWIHAVVDELQDLKVLIDVPNHKHPSSYLTQWDVNKKKLNE